MPSIVYASNTKKVWNYFQERFDKSNPTGIYHLWTAIATFRQGMDLVTSYYSKMKNLWDELDVLVPLPSCDCEKSKLSVDHLKNIRRLQFFMGLNESYSNIHNNVLAKRLVATANVAYAIISQAGENQSPSHAKLIRAQQVVLVTYLTRKWTHLSYFEAKFKRQLKKGYCDTLNSWSSGVDLTCNLYFLEICNLPIFFYY
uniref:Uncharacterized protein LOC104245258 isoform X1 n=1 Tax=Nicotiana sylvestris TaxID=4096 RepID=A0A1U7YIQ4_NICSY|nr:PREDICTED: uncharacterized protein LOC104245258 isoform X1 [Nicotiana sylvestris]